MQMQIKQHNRDRDRGRGGWGRHPWASSPPQKKGCGHTHQDKKDGNIRCVCPPCPSKGLMDVLCCVVLCCVVLCCVVLCCVVLCCVVLCCVVCHRFVSSMELRLCSQHMMMMMLGLVCVCGNHHVYIYKCTYNIT
jgi:hypothetical protein